MPARLLEGRPIAARVRDEVALRAQRLRDAGVAPRLIVCIVGDDPPGVAYARALERSGAKSGVDVAIAELPAGAREDDVRARLAMLGDDPTVHGIILQQPLPAPLEIRRIAEALPPAKDVDATGPLQFGRLAHKSDGAFVAATPLAVMLLLEESTRRPLRGVRCCVVGRSTVVGLPVALLLLAQDATVSIVHRSTVDLAQRTREADVLVVAAGMPRLLRAPMVAPGATVIDVGTTYVNGAVAGDVAFDEVADIAGEITPVPGGVGPVTNVVLLRNVVLAAERLAAASIQ